MKLKLFYLLQLEVLFFNLLINTYVKLAKNIMVISSNTTVIILMPLVWNCCKPVNLTFKFAVTIFTMSNMVRMKTPSHNPPAFPKTINISKTWIFLIFLIIVSSGLNYSLICVHKSSLFFTWYDDLILVVLHGILQDE